MMNSFSDITIPVSEIAELNGVQCSPLIVSGEWRQEIRTLLSNPALASKPYLNRVKEALEAVNQAQVDSNSLYIASSTIRMSICDFSTQYQSVLRKMVNNLTMRAAMEGEKEAVYDLMDTYPLPQDLAYISVNEEERVLSINEFKAIRENLEEAEVYNVCDAGQLKEIVKNALSKARSTHSSLITSSREVY